MKFRLRPRARSLAICLCGVLALPILYSAASVTLPYISPVFEKATILSASLSFMVHPNFYADSDLGELVDKDEPLANTNNEIDIPYEEDSVPPPPSSQLSSQEQPKQPLSQNLGTIRKKTYLASNSAAYINLKDGFIKNCTSIPPAKILDTVKNKPKFKIKGDNKPEVLIMHTHTTESFQMTDSPTFNVGESSRTTDNTKNMVRVGDEIEKQLKLAGIGVIHNKTQHDYPSYNGAYERSAVTVKKILKENPTIKVVLDVHRDAIQPDAKTMVAPVTTIDGKSCAQVMIISGCDDGKMNMPNYMENLKFSAALQRQMWADYPTLARPVMFDYRKYNQNLTTGSILLEMGGHANTLDEAIYCGELVGKSLVKTLLSLKAG